MMLESYEININTLVLLPNVNKSYVKVHEIYADYKISLEVNKIIKNSCEFYGSSYEGRYYAIGKIIGSKTKLPILIEETAELIFFPTNSSREKKCIWISYNNLEKYEKTDNNKTILYFRGNQVFKLPVSYYIIDNQINRCLKIAKHMKKIKNNL